MGAPVVFGPNNRATNLQNGFLNSDGSTVKNDGLINYIQNPGFENGTTNGWTLSKVTLTNNFPSAPAGAISAGVTFVPYQTTVLSGNYSGAFTSTTSFVAGDSLVSSTMTIDPKYQSQVISFSFSYKVDAGASLGVFAGNNTNTFGIAIYDVTNGVFVQPSSGLWSINAYAGTAAGQFQTASNGSQYQFAIFANTGVTGAFRFLVDDFFWGASVPAGNDGRVIAAVANGSATTIANATATTLNITAASIDTTSSITTGASGKFTVPMAGIYSVYAFAQAAVTLATTGNYVQLYLYKNGSAFALLDLYQPSAGTGVASNIYLKGGISVLCQAGDTLDIRGFNNSGASGSFTLQTFNISRLAGPTSGDEGRVVAMRANGQPPTGTLANAYNNTVYGTLISDSAGAYNPATGIYTIQQSGYFDVSAASAVTATYAAGALLGVTINANGTIVAEGVQVSSSAYTGGLYVQANMKAIYLTAGTTVNVKTLVSGSSPSWINSYSLNYFTLSRVSGPNATSAQETVALRYSNTAGTSLPATTVTSVPFAVKDYDTNSLYNGTTATIQSAGKYRITCGIITAATTLATTGTVSTQVYKNGSFNTIIGGASGNGAAVTRAVNGTTTLNLVAGDTIDLRVYTDSATTLLTTSGYNYFEIQKVGN